MLSITKLNRGIAGLFAGIALLALTAVPALRLDGATAMAQGAGPVIRGIQIIGNRRVEPETVRSYLQFQRGDRYDPFKVDQSLKALFATGLFSDVNIRRKGNSVVVNVVENPLINKVVFEGNSEVDDATLKSEVQLKARSVYTRARVQSDVKRILDVYSRQGRFAARVNPQIIRIKHNRVNLVYEIDEGPKTTVKSINFIGNQAFTDKQLLDIITTSESGLFSYFSSTNIYDPDRLNLDRELLRQYYLKNGYADARVISAIADLDPTGDGFFITFTVEEGEIYRFGTIDVQTSLEALDPESLRQEMKTQSGAIYNAAQIDKSIEALTLKVAELGYAFARVRPQIDRDPIARTIDINYIVEQGPRVYIERINISGNSRTKDYVIRREFRLAEGDAYNRLLVRRARRRLQGLGFFKKVDIRRTPGSARDRIVLNVTVIEQSTGELAFSAGYSSAEGVVGDISITERNLMGKGQFLRLKLGGSFERAQIDLSFTEPRFLDRNIAAGFDLFHKAIDYSDESGYKLFKTGGTLRVGFPLSENIWLNTRYNLTRDNVFDVDPAVASKAIIASEGITITSSVGYTLSFDTRNHKKNPSRGLYASLTQDVAGIGGDVNYVRSLIEGRAYYPIANKITLVGRIIGGHVVEWGGDEIRTQHAFRRGGETVRGFARSGYGPRDSVTKDSIGGKVFAAGTVEVRFPLPLIPESLGLGGAVFADAGTLYKGVDNGSDPVLGNNASLRSSVGASLLWESPLGPLRADFAYVLTSEAFDEEEAFRFGASTRF